MRHNDAPVKDILSELMRSHVYRTKITEVKIRLAWKAVVGEVVARYTDKLEFAGGVLTVTLTSAPLRQNLLFEKLKILTQLNTEIGEELIKTIDIY